VVGASWIVSAWPGLLVKWNGLPFAPVVGLVMLTGFVAWQVVVGAAPVGDPGAWISQRVRLARRDRSPKSGRWLAVTVALDTAAWAATGVGWCVAARRFGFSEVLTGGLFQFGTGLALVAWAGLHLNAVAASRLDLVVVSRRVLGCGPLTVVPPRDRTSQ
jgi:hypothetical protein